MAYMLGLFKEEDAESAANATEALEQAGYTNENFDILTGSPFPVGCAWTLMRSAAIST